MAAGDAYRITNTMTLCGIDTDFMNKNTEEQPIRLLPSAAAETANTTMGNFCGSD